MVGLTNNKALIRIPNKNKIKWKNLVYILANKILIKKNLKTNNGKKDFFQQFLSVINSIKCQLISKTKFC